MANSTKSMLRVEYLLTVPANSPHCSTKETFNNLLKVNEFITINTDHIFYKGIRIDYNIITDLISNKLSRYFHVKFSADSNNIDIYSDFLKSFKTVITNFFDHTCIINLWDDISFLYAHKSYPLIHEIENLMRMLYTKFMVINLDKDWLKSNIPEDVKIRTEKKGEKSESFTNEYLYKTDFIDLQNFLTTKLKTPSLDSIYKKIESANSIEEMNLTDLKSIIPTNNWSKYFHSILGGDLKFITTRWERLYVLRCKVAHNSSINKSEYLEIEALVKALKPIISKAISDLNTITVEEEDKLAITGNLSRKSPDLVSRFLGGCLEIESIISFYFADYGEEEDSEFYKKLTIQELIKLLFEQSKINNLLFENLLNIFSYRDEFIKSRQPDVYRLMRLENIVFASVDMLTEQLQDYESNQFI